MSNDKIKDLLMKLRALAEQGVDGEKQNAETMLQKMLSKYNMTMADILIDAKTERRFAGIYEKDGWLFLQISAKVMSLSSIVTTRKPGRHGEVWMDCTPSQFIEIRSMFEFFLRAFKKEEELLRMAFVSRHRLWNENGTPSNWEDLTKEEQDRITKARRMANELSEAGYYRQIESQAK